MAAWRNDTGVDKMVVNNVPLGSSGYCSKLVRLPSSWFADFCQPRNYLVIINKALPLCEGPSERNKTLHEQQSALRITPPNDPTLQSKVQLWEICESSFHGQNESIESLSSSPSYLSLTGNDAEGIVCLLLLRGALSILENPNKNSPKRESPCASAREPMPPSESIAKGATDG